MNWWKKVWGRDGLCSRTVKSTIHKLHPHTHPYMWCTFMQLPESAWVYLQWCNKSCRCTENFWTISLNTTRRDNVCEYGWWMLDIWSFLNTSHPYLVPILFLPVHPYLFWSVCTSTYIIAMHNQMNIFLTKNVRTLTISLNSLPTIAA